MYVYAPYDDMMSQVEGCVTSCGFDIAYDVAYFGEGPNCRLQATLKLTYGGHTECNNFACRVSPASDMLTAAQMDMKARTTARRGALCDALNIVIDKEDDALIEGTVIDAETARAFRFRLQAINGNEAAFLKLAGAKDFATIREAKLPMLEKTLEGLEKKAGAKGAATDGGSGAASTDAPGGGATVRAAPTPPSAPSPARQRLYNLLRAIAKHRNVKFDDLWIKAAGANLDYIGTIWTLLEADVPKMLKVAETVAKKEKIDAAPFLEGGPEHQPLSAEREPGQ
jgi:hypothetical protein